MPQSSPMRPMSDEEIHVAALQHPDAQSLTAGMAQIRPVPRATTLRRAFGLTQEALAMRYQIPVATLRDRDQRKAEPDQPARASLKAIAGDPDAVQEALDNAARSAQ